MATLTREQIIKLNNGCYNGFYLDVYGTISNNGVKQFAKEIKLDNGKILKAQIIFHNRWDHVAKKNINRPIIWLNEYAPKGSVMVSHGLGYREYLDSTIYPRRNTKVLQEATKEWTDEKIVALYNEKKQTQVNLLK